MNDEIIEGLIWVILAPIAIAANIAFVYGFIRLIGWMDGWFGVWLRSIV